MSISLNENIDLSTQEALVEASGVRQRDLENFKSQEKILGKIAELQIQAGQDAALMATIKHNADLEAQNKTIQIAQAAGADPSIAGAELLTIVQEQTKANKAFRENLTEYNRKKNISIFEDPVGWIGSVFTIGKTYTAVEDSAKMSAVLGQQAQSINRAVQESAQTQLAIKRGINQSFIEANGRMIANAYQAKAYEAEIEGLKTNSAGVHAAMKTSFDMLGALYNQKSAANAEIQLQRSLDALEQNKEEFKWRKEDALDRREAIKDAKTATADAKLVDEETANIINLGRGILGYPSMSPVEMKSSVQLLKSGQSKDLALQYELGAKLKATGIPVYGNTPYDTFKTLEQANQSVLKAKEETLNLFNQAYQEVLANPKIARKDEAAIKEEFNKRIKVITSQDLKNIRPGSIFAIDPASFLGDPSDPQLGVKDIMSLGISQKVLIPAIQAKQSLADPKTVLSMGVAAVESGLITSGEFAELGKIYQKGSLINSQYHNFLGSGMVLPMNGKNYMAKVTSFGEPIDLADPTALGRYLSSQLAAKRGNEMFKTERPGRRF